MNFTPQLTALQGVMISADNVHSFSNLTAKGGNEEEINEVILCVKNFLEKEKYIINNSLDKNSIEITRKFAFYLILNADLKILESMVEKEGLDFLIWTIPTVPKCLVCELLWKLHMGQFIKEVIAFSCPELSLEMAECLTNHMKYMSPMESADKLSIILAACYKFLCRLNFFDIDENKLNSTYNIFQKCLKYFPTPPNVRKLESMKRNQLYKYIGNTLHKLLLLLYECVDEFNGRQKFELQNDINIYMLTYNEESIVCKNDVKTCDSKKIVLDCLYKCHETLLDILKELVMGVSVDIFCTWSEFECNGKSMQQTIGELCYKLRDVLLRIECVMDHPVVEMLKQISCKPVEISDIINTTSSEDILKNINDGPDNHLWIQALLKRSDLFKESELLETIILNFNVIQENNFYKIYLDCIEHLKNSNDNEDTVKVLAIKAFQYCDVTTKLNIIDDTFTNKIFHDNMRTSELDLMMNNIFNKLIATLDEDFSDILSVFIQCPKTVYSKIFTLATENAHQSIIMGHIVKYLDKYSLYYYNDETEPCLIKRLQEIVSSGVDNEMQQGHFINFVKNIKENNIVSCPTLLILVIMPDLHTALVNKKLSNICIHLKLLLDAFSIEELLDYRAPMLAMIAQVLEVVRWKVGTFNLSYPSCLELAIKLQKLLMESYKNNIPEKESTWLKSKLKNKNPLNMYYYRMLWPSCGKTYFEVLTGMSLHGIDNDKLSFLLSQILTVTVLEEWYELWDDLPLDIDTRLSVFHNALISVSRAEKAECTKLTVLYCHRNSLVLMKHKYIHEPITDKQVYSIMGQLAGTAEMLDKENVEEFKSLFLPLLGYIAERRNEYTLDVLDLLNNTFPSRLLLEIAKTVFQ